MSNGSRRSGKRRGALALAPWCALAAAIPVALVAIVALPAAAQQQQATEEAFWQASQQSPQQAPFQRESRQDAPAISVRELPPYPIQGLAAPPVQGPLPGVIREGTLNPRLPGDAKQLRFSPDGNYILAQDDSSIFILTRQPLAVRFRIAATGADRAQFTPDSSQVVFLTGGAHLAVERWKVADSVSAGRHELDTPDCFETRLAPDGNTVACFSHDTDKVSLGRLPGIDLALIDVPSGKTILQRQNFLPGDYLYSPLISDMAELIGRLSDAGISSSLSMIPASFSTDSKYFLAGFEKQVLAYDLTEHAAVPLQGSFEHMLAIDFTFVSPNEVLALNPGEEEESCDLVEFPGGLVTKNIRLKEQTVEAATRGNYLFLRPSPEVAVGIVDWNKPQKPMTELRQDVGVDIYQDHMVTQTLDGQVALFDFPTMRLASSVRLPFDPSEPMQAGAVSPDLQWLALSLRTRSGVWNLSANGGPYLLPTFHSGHFFADSSFYADAPPQLNTPRSVARVNLTDGKVTSAYPIDEPTRRYNQRGRFLLWMTEASTPKGDPEYTLHVGDTQDAHVLWTRAFPKETPAHIEITPDQNRMVLRWNLNQKSALDEIRKDKALKTRYDAMQDRTYGSLFEVLDADTGRIEGSVLANPPVATGPSAAPGAAIDLVAGGNLAMSQQSENAIKIVGGFPEQRPRPQPPGRNMTPPDAFASGDFLFVTSQGATQVYSVSTGQLRASMPGTAVIASASAGLFATAQRVSPKDYALQFYSFAAQTVSRLSFASAVAMVRFSEDGSRLLVLNQYQQFFVFDAASLSRETSTQADAR